jgi:putative ABC transport system permease protein
MTVVGVVGDVKQGRLDAATVPHTYEPYAQLGVIGSLRVAVRGEGNAENQATTLRTVVWGLDRQLALGHMRSMQQVINRSTEARRFNLLLLASFATLALLLAAIGIYGVLAYSVTRRTHEIGVRMALGASAGDVARLVLGQGVRVTAIGMVLGVAGALALMRFLEGLLFEVRPMDLPTVAGVLLLLSVAALAASYLPARRATRIKPTVALRHE